MGTEVFVWSGDCRIITAGLATAANRPFNGVTGTPAASTSVVHGTHAASLHFAAAATRPYVNKTFPATQSVMYWFWRFRVDDATPAADALLIQGTITVGNNFTLYLKTTGVIEVSYIGNAAQSSAALSADTWYTLEMEVDISVNPHIVKWRIDGVAQTNSSYAVAADTFTTSGVNFGEPIAGPTSAWNLYTQDIVCRVGTTPGEYYGVTAKDWRVKRHKVSADLTHAFTTNDFEYNDTTGINSAATDVYTYLDEDDMASLSDFISQNVAGAGKLIQLAFADEGTETQPRIVAVVSTHHSAGTGANEQHLRVSDDGATWTNVWGDWSAAGVDISDTTAHYLYKTLSAPPSGGSWDTSKVSGMRAQWGNSDDVSAIPYIDSLSLEVAYEVAAAGTLSDPMGMSGFFGV